MKYSWAVNPTKLARAIAKAGVGATELTIKEVYVSLAGLLSKESVIEEYHDQTSGEVDSDVSETKPIRRRSPRAA